MVLLLQDSKKFMYEKDILFSCFIFFLVFAVHLASSNICSCDSMWSIYTALSILREGNTDLDEYEDILRVRNYYAIEKIQGHYYTMFPAGVSFVALPLVYVGEVSLNSSLFQNRLIQHYIESRLPDRSPQTDLILEHIVGIEFAIACFFVALTSVVIYFISRLFVNPVKAGLIVLIFAFGTSAWSTASRGLWQHGPSMLMLSAALYLILLARTREWAIAFVGLLLALAYVVRPTNSLPLFFLSVFVLFRHRRHLFAYLLGLLIVLVPFVVFNWHIYRQILPPYYLPGRIGASSRFGEALIGNLISPARGLFIYMPFLIFSLYGIVLKFRQDGFLSLNLALVSVLLAHWVVISAFPHWWAGHSFGPRFFCDMIPFFIYFLIPVIEQIPRLRRGRLAMALILICLVLVSVFIHYRGANSLDVLLWNDFPISVDRDPSRLWDWRDISFLRGL